MSKKDVKHGCCSCAHYDKPAAKEPCKSCERWSKWVEKEG